MIIEIFKKLSDVLNLHSAPNFQLSIIDLPWAPQFPQNLSELREFREETVIHICFLDIKKLAF